VALAIKTSVAFCKSVSQKLSACFSSKSMLGILACCFPARLDGQDPRRDVMERVTLKIMARNLPVHLNRSCSGKHVLDDRETII
jgi:hypothetical protein